MNKLKLTFTLFILYMLIGLTLMIIPLFQYDATSPAHIISICLGFLIFISILFGTIAYYNHYKQMSILMPTQAPLAKWSFTPEKYQILQDKFLQEYRNLIVLNLLVCALCWVLGIGILFSSVTHKVLICLLICGFSLVICLALNYKLSQYYDVLLSQKLDVVFTPNFVYYRENIYGFYYSIYTLSEVYVAYSTEPTLNFSYCSCPDLYTPNFMLSLPIPEGHMEEAIKLAEHYNQLINIYSDTHEALYFHK
ncbi:MAG: hypothetical protein ATN36_01515 [Epulopiscium sp. Nele67-Bin005]|nr:MAG: hypothetical protein ATN36_01515 [Epulopiscium sp. Nele67-Bin005]